MVTSKEIKRLLNEARQEERQRILEIIDKWFVAEIGDVFPLNDLDLLKQKIKKKGK